MLEADALQIGGDHLSGLTDIVFVLFGGADTGNAKQIFKLVEKPLLVLARVGKGRGTGCRCHTGKYSFRVERMRIGKLRSISQRSL